MNKTTWIKSFSPNSVGKIFPYYIFIRTFVHDAIIIVQLYCQFFSIQIFIPYFWTMAINFCQWDESPIKLVNCCPRADEKNRCGQHDDRLDFAGFLGRNYLSK